MRQANLGDSGIFEQRKTQKEFLRYPGSRTYNLINPMDI